MSTADSPASWIVFHSTELPALGPKHSSAAWPYSFTAGQMAWAKGGNGVWRKVKVLDEGSIDVVNGRNYVSYTATWVNESGFTFRAPFAPGLGEIKPDCEHVRRLLADEGVEIQPAGGARE